MTKVLRIIQTSCLFTAILLPFPPGARAVESPSEKPAEALYMQLGKVGLDPQRVYQVREAALDRGAIHISLEDGTIGFTQDVMGRITGAFFEGDGEILLTPPNEVERRSMSLFTGMAILEERFATAYFRFDDDAAAELRPDLRSTDKKDEFVERYEMTTKNLAGFDAMRLLSSFSELLPVSEASQAEVKAVVPGKPSDRFLHARLQGLKLGVFDVYFDSLAPEQILAGQAKTAENGETYYDVWTSFSQPHAKSMRQTAATADPQSESGVENKIATRSYSIEANVVPPKQIYADATLQCEVRADGTRLLMFELSRFLQIESVRLDGRPVEYIHNPALQGTQLARKGNDVVAVILPHPFMAGQRFELEFVYGGEVLAEAGSGLLYVGARGTWYPNRGLDMANFDLRFTYPQGWMLLATGKHSSPLSESTGTTTNEQSSRWVSERPIPVAGFNLGRYHEATTRGGDVSVETYATQGVERDFPTPAIEVVEPNRPDPNPRPPQVIVPSRPSPAQHEVVVGESAAQAIQFFADRFGPFPYSHLALTQMPGRESQGWPGLVFLSSYAFLNDQQREQLHFDHDRILLQHFVPAHEVAHQWWGDLMTWGSYRDQWFSEGLANYCALMMLEQQNSAGFHQLMDMYRRELLQKDKDGMTPMDAGPVTLGTRLLSSRFPGGYEAISYGRGTWLFHMLRTMLNDGVNQERSGRTLPNGTDEPFIRALRRLRQRYEGRSITTRDLLDALADELPPALRYEGKKSLDWFLAGWINGTSLPKMELKGVRFAAKGNGLIVTGTIIQKEAPPDLVTSIPLYAALPGRQPVLLGRVFADGEESSFHLSAPAGTRKLLLDPYDTVLTRK